MFVMPPGRLPEGTTNPNHVTAGFPQDCTVCHTTTQWTGATFNHSTTTIPPDRSPCAGHLPAVPHRRQVCRAFYGMLRVPPDRFQRHDQSESRLRRLQPDCTNCHTTVQWQGATFNHSTTQFPLTGAHVPVACQRCHTSGPYSSTPVACSACHMANFTGTTNPNHVTAGFPQTCTTCHTTTQWQGASFNHGTTRFILTGAHLQVSCTLCHTNGRYAGTPTTCSSCHLSRYTGTTNPNHVAAGFPQDCSLCHTTTRWTGATFNHATTRFPLTGAHVSLQCQNCHAGGQYAGMGTACANCHLSRYNATVNPNHRTAGFPQDCTVCHATTAWTPSSFNHGTTRFPLSGRHTSVTCVSCHIAGVYAGTPTNCYACHSQVYSSTTDPNHVAAGFPTTCNTCHTMNGWTGATFTHSKFPIYSGRHSGKWSSCIVCHTNPTNYTVFSCFGCHEHDKAAMDSEHRGRSGYAYNSTNCYSCHPNGSS